MELLHGINDAKVNVYWTTTKKLSIKRLKNKRFKLLNYVDS